MSILNLKNSFSKIGKPVRLVRRFKKDENGATAVEFAFVAGPFFLLVFAIFETAIYFWANQYLETIVDDVTRLYRTGQFVSTNPQWDIRTKQGFDDEICRRVKAMFDCDDIITQVDQAPRNNPNNFVGIPLPPRSDDPANFQGTKFMPPERFPAEICPLRVTQVTASYEWPTFTNYSAPLLANDRNSNALINVTTITRTEDFTLQPGSNC